MIEFGEQLKRAREAKGMTQQSLAEQLYVTRQAVSRWECGNRYPDLLTTKKISLILDISLDDLLSENEMKKVVERNPVIEKPFANNIMIAFYAFIVFSFAVTAVDMLLNIVKVSSNSNTIDFNYMQAIAINLMGLIIQCAVFTFGLINALKGMLSPKRTGLVISVFFASTCFSDFNRILGDTTWQLLFAFGVLMIPCITGAIASFMYFIRANTGKICPILIYLACLWGIMRMIIANYMFIRYAGDFLAMNTALGILLKICIYILILYQTYILGQKRKHIFKS